MYTLSEYSCAVFCTILLGVQFCRKQDTATPTCMCLRANSRGTLRQPLSQRHHIMLLHYMDYNFTTEVSLIT